ncbi:hypothetical protein [Streptomyces monashensis]|uniref:hypothetical protein n=1 Tax=Streptomyces monashensis TaxID=1678012 RepID=UPI001160B4AB|nr:hypothetical protein [Streptomyces monashensis]
MLIAPDGRVQLWSEGVQALTGYPGWEIVGQDSALLGDQVTVRGRALVRALLRTAGGARTD